jgi:hypothetical protein
MMLPQQRLPRRAPAMDAFLGPAAKALPHGGFVDENG